MHGQFYLTLKSNNKCPILISSLIIVFSCCSPLLRFKNSFKFNPHTSYVCFITREMLLDSTLYILYPNSQTTFLLYVNPSSTFSLSCLLPPPFPLFCHHLQTTYLLMMCCKRLLLCFHAALSIYPLTLLFSMSSCPSPAFILFLNP